MASRAAAANTSRTETDDRAEAERRIRLGILDERVQAELRERVEREGCLPVARDYQITRGALTSYIAGAAYKATIAFVQLQRLHRGRP